MSNEQIRGYFRLFTIFWWVGYPLVFLLIGIPFLITATVFGCFLMYDAWRRVQREGLKVTPGEAIGFSFIPFYNFYWWFVCFVTLATELNARLEARGLPLRVSRNLAIANCILNIIGCTLGLIPQITLLLLIPCAITEFIYMLQVKNALLALNPDEVAVPATVPASLPTPGP